jgi:hypothetical protein
MCIMITLVPETPRYLINRGKSEQGLKNLAVLRKLPVNHIYVQTEFREIEAQHLYEQETHKGHNYWVVVKDVFTDRSNFRRFFLVSLGFVTRLGIYADHLRPSCCSCSINSQVPIPWLVGTLLDDEQSYKS